MREPAYFVVLLPLTKRSERPPVPLLWLACLPLAVDTGALVWLLRHRTRTAPPTTG